MTDGKKKPVVPKGKKKGGSIFPRIDLEQAVKYASKLVSKTHTGAQSPATLFPGVFGAAGSRGAVRSSALKQYGLMEGSDKDGYSATKLAIDVKTAPPEDRAPLLRGACLKPKVFAALFETYHGDEVSIAKIRQQAAAAKVHPDELDNCAEIFAKSAVYAGLAQRAGDQLKLIDSKEAAAPGQEETQHAIDVVLSDSQDPGSEAFAETEEGRNEDTGSDRSANASHQSPRDSQQEPPPSARAVIHVNVTLDSSLDTEKLERQLSLLRRFGAI